MAFSIGDIVRPKYPESVKVEHLIVGKDAYKYKVVVLNQSHKGSSNRGDKIELSIDVVDSNGILVRKATNAELLLYGT